MTTFYDSFDATVSRAEARGMATRYAGRFPELPLPAMPAFASDEPMSVLRLRTVRKAAATHANGRRTHPEPRVGDVLGGNHLVVEVLGRGHMQRADLRLLVECTGCGRRIESFEYNARHGHQACAAGAR